jgi:hypothetical protein
MRRHLRAADTARRHEVGPAGYGVGFAFAEAHQHRGWARPRYLRDIVANHRHRAVSVLSAVHRDDRAYRVTCGQCVRTESKSTRSVPRDTSEEGAAMTNP